MKYVPQHDDDDSTTINIPKRVRRKLGLLVNKNDNLNVGLEKILDKHIKELPEP